MTDDYRRENSMVAYGNHEDGDEPEIDHDVQAKLDRDDELSSGLREIARAQLLKPMEGRKQ